MTNAFNALLKVKIMPDIICLIGGETSLYLIIDGVGSGSLHSLIFIQHSMSVR